MAALIASSLKGFSMEPSILWLGVVAIVPIISGGAGDRFLPGSGGGGTAGGLLLISEKILWGTETHVAGGELVTLGVICKTDLRSALA